MNDFWLIGYYWKELLKNRMKEDDSTKKLRNLRFQDLFLLRNAKGRES